jgi:hypothetical protein
MMNFQYICIDILYRDGMQLCSGWGTALHTGRSQDRSPIVSLEFFIDIILLASNRNEYKEYFLGVKAAGA